MRDRFGSDSAVAACPRHVRCTLNTCRDVVGEPRLQYSRTDNPERRAKLEEYRGETIVPVTELSISDAERLRAFERQGHDALAATYHEFFTPVTAAANVTTRSAHSIRGVDHS